MTPPSFSPLFTLLLLLLLLLLPEAQKTPCPPSHSLSMQFVRLLALICVKGTFRNAWLLNLVSPFLVPHSVIKLMVCVPFLPALLHVPTPFFIEYSRSLKPGSSRCFFGSTIQPLSPTPVSYCGRNHFAQILRGK